MLINSSRIENSKVHATDGHVGKVETFLFDEEQWVIRYIVAKHGFLIFGGRVLISPISVTGTVEEGGAVTVGLTKQQIKNAPSADLARPVSRRKEEQFFRYYQIPVYWGGAGLWGSAMTPMEVGTVTYGPEVEQEPLAAADEEYHLRSTHEVEGYHVQTTDKQIGSVKGFVVEDSTWAVRYLQIDAYKEFGHGNLYISPHWVDEISWIERTLTLEMDSKRLREAPTVGVEGTLSREEEEKLYEFFGRDRYWE
ncbi:MAG: PRC-barrel domain-containing protein [Spirochaetota bacterium]